MDTKLGILDTVYLKDGTEVRLIGFGPESTVQVGYYNIIGEYKRAWLSRENVLLYKPKFV